MKETIESIQDWCKLNCNGDWEHSYGYSIATLGNPGWSIRIDLEEACLDKLDFNREFQNPVCEHLRLIEIPKVQYEEIKVKDNSKINFDQSDLEKFLNRVC